MEHISKRMKKYSKTASNLDKLNSIRMDIEKITGIKPVSLKIHNNNIVVKVNNQYEALEIRYKYKNNNYKVKIVL